MKRLTAIIDAADASGVSQWYAVTFSAATADEVPATALAEFEETFGFGDGRSRGEEIVCFLPDLPEVEIVTPGEMDAEEAACTAFDAAYGGDLLALVEAEDGDGEIVWHAIRVSPDDETLIAQLVANEFDQRVGYDAFYSWGAEIKAFVSDCEHVHFAKPDVMQAAREAFDNA